MKTVARPAIMRWLAIVIAMATLMNAKAQTPSAPGHKWLARVEASAYNTIDWGIELGLDFHPISWIGLGAGLLLTDNFNGSSRTFTVGNMNVITDPVMNNVWLRAGLQLHSPTMWQNSDGDLRLSARADVGLTFPAQNNRKLGYRVIPNAPGTYPDDYKQYETCHGGNSCYIHIKPAVALDIDRCQVWIGYTWSGMDAYQRVRKTSIAGHRLDLPSKHSLHGLTAGFGFHF